VFADSAAADAIGNFIDTNNDVFDLGFVPDIDFEASAEAFEDCSLALVQIPDAESTITPLDGSCSELFSGGDALCLQLTDGTQVLTIADEVLSSITSISLQPGNANNANGGLSTQRALVINVIDRGEPGVVVNLASTNWNQLGQAKNVIWNFPNTDQLTIQSDLRGTILAPRSDLVTNGGVAGAIVAQDWIHNGGTVQNGGDNQFDSTIDWGE